MTHCMNFEDDGDHHYATYKTDSNRGAMRFRYEAIKKLRKAGMNDAVKILLGMTASDYPNGVNTFDFFFGETEEK